MMGGMHGETNWLPPLIVLGVGLVIGLVLAFRAARGRRAAVELASADDVEVRDLRVRRDQLIAQLRELDDTADKRAPEELARARWALELDAARTLLALERAEARAAAAAPQAAPAPAAPRASAWVGALWGGGVVGFAALLFFVLQGQVAQRAPGGSITGNDVSVNGRAGQAPVQPDPELQALSEKARANPRDLDAQLDLAQALLQRERLVDVFFAAQAAQEIDPDNPRALTYEAVVRHAMGQGDLAMQLFDKALARDPSLAEGWVRRGLVAFDLARYADAVTSWEKALELRPDGKAALQPVIDEARMRMKVGAGATAGVGAPATGAAAGMQGGAAAADAQGSYRLVLDLDPAAAERVSPGTPIFVAVRPAGVKAGPPAAVKRLAAGSFPITVVIGAGDTMMGQPLPPSAYVEARIDSDGNAMTRSPSDPTASADGVNPNTELRLVLRPAE